MNLIDSRETTTNANQFLADLWFGPSLGKRCLCLLPSRFKATQYDVEPFHIECRVIEALATVAILRLHFLTSLQK